MLVVRSKLKAAESEQRKYKQACGDQHISQPPEWVSMLEAKLSQAVPSSAPRSAAADHPIQNKRSANEGNTDADLQQLQRPFKSPKV